MPAKSKKWNGKCPAGLHGLDYQAQVCNLCPPKNPLDDMPARPPRTDYPNPIEFVVRERSDATRTGQVFQGGYVRFRLENGEEIEIEAFVRPGNPLGLMVRGITCSLDIQPEVSNTIIVKPRSR